MNTKILTPSLTLVDNNPINCAPIDINVLLDFLAEDATTQIEKFVPFFTCSCGYFECGGYFSYLKKELIEDNSALVIKNAYDQNKKLVDTFEFKIAFEPKNSNISLRSILTQYLETTFIGEEYRVLLDSLRYKQFHNFKKVFTDLVELQNKNSLQLKSTPKRGVLQKLVRNIKLYFLIKRLNKIVKSGKVINQEVRDTILQRSNKSIDEWVEIFLSDTELYTETKIKDTLAKYDLYLFAVQEILNEMSRESNK